MSNTGDVKVTICVYGTAQVGFHCLGEIHDGSSFKDRPRFGGEPEIDPVKFPRHPIMIEAIWAIQDEIVMHLLNKGIPGDAIISTPLAIHMNLPDGTPKVCKITLGRVTYSDLKWV